MTDWQFAGVVLVFKVITELVARCADNDYLTGRSWRAASLMALVVAAGVPIGRVVIADGNDYAAAAVVLAVFVTTWAGCRDLEKRKRGKQ